MPMYPVRERLLTGAPDGRRRLRTKSITPRCSEVSLPTEGARVGGGQEPFVLAS